MVSEAGAAPAGDDGLLRTRCVKAGPPLAWNFKEDRGPQLPWPKKTRDSGSHAVHPGPRRPVGGGLPQALAPLWTGSLKGKAFALCIFKSWAYGP